MRNLAPSLDRRRPPEMANVSRLDPDTAWAAFMRRDRSWDGRVIGAVKTTGIYCKPSCPARRPKREHVEFFTSGEEARAAGYRPCLRCKPDEVGRDREAVASAVAVIEQAEEAVRRSEKQLRDVIETMPAMAFTVRPDGSTEFVNRRFTEYTGLKAEEVGSHRRNIIHPEDFEGYMDQWKTSLASGEPWRIS